MLSETELAGRVSERCREIGRTLAEVLSRAGVSRAFLSARPKHGRRLDRLEALARELNWTITDLLGLGVSPRVDSALLAKALRLAARLVQRQPAGGERDALTAEFATAIYEWLVKRAAEGHPVIAEDDEASLSLIEWVLDRFVARGPQPERENGGGHGV
jgi:hypothetical protein